MSSIALKCLRDLKYGTISSTKHGIFNKVEAVSRCIVNCCDCSDRLYLGLFVRGLSQLTGLGYACLDGLVALKHSYWNGRAVGRAIQFFIERHDKKLAQPQLEVSILKPRKYSNEIISPDQREKVREVWIQSLLVTARNNAIGRLRVKVSVAGWGSSYFRWGLPLIRIDGEPESDLEDIFKREIESFVTLVCNESLHIPIYIFLRTETDAFLQLNTEGHRMIKLSDTIATPVDVEIQFLAQNYTDSEPRRYTLHVESLDKLGLAERT